jgi:hypothetical protein
MVIAQESGRASNDKNNGYCAGIALAITGFQGIRAADSMPIEREAGMSF